MVVAPGDSNSLTCIQWSVRHDHRSRNRLFVSKQCARTASARSCVPPYAPTLSHLSIDMFCRIISTTASIGALPRRNCRLALDHLRRAMPMGGLFTLTRCMQWRTKHTDQASQRQQGQDSVTGIPPSVKASSWRCAMRKCMRWRRTWMAVYAPVSSVAKISQAGSRSGVVNMSTAAAMPRYHPLPSNSRTRNDSLTLCHTSRSLVPTPHNGLPAAEGCKAVPRLVLWSSSSQESRNNFAD